MSKLTRPEGYTRKSILNGLGFLFFIAVVIFTSYFFLCCGGKKSLKETESLPSLTSIISESTVVAIPLEYSGEFVSGEGLGVGSAASKGPRESAKIRTKEPALIERLTAAEETDPRKLLFSQISNGAVSYSIPTAMVEGQSYAAYLRIDDKISNALTEGLDNTSVAEINVSATMRAILTAGKSIEIDSSYSSSTQLRKVGEPTEWKWSLKPLKSGTHSLRLKVVCILKRQGYTDETYDLKTFEKELTVRVDPWYRIRNILKKYWSIIMGMLVSSSAVGWVFKKVFKRKKKENK